MKKVLLFALAVFFLVTANTAWCTHPAAENGSWTGVEKRAEKLSFIETIHKDFQQTFGEVKSAIETYVHTVVTVATALIKAAITVVVVVAKVVVRFVLAVMLIVVRWLLGLFIPI